MSTRTPLRWREVALWVSSDTYHRHRTFDSNKVRADKALLDGPEGAYGTAINAGGAVLPTLSSPRPRLIVLGIYQVTDYVPQDNYSHENAYAGMHTAQNGCAGSYGTDVAITKGGHGHEAEVEAGDGRG